MCVGVTCCIVQAAVTKYSRLSGLNNRHLFLTFMEAESSKNKVPSDSVSLEEGPLPRLQMAAFLLYPHISHGGEGGRELWFLSFLIRALIPSWEFHSHDSV